MYYVLWDCECQCELMRADTVAEIEAMDGVFGGGTFMIYPCPKYFKIVKTEGRTKEQGSLRILLESVD